MGVKVKALAVSALAAGIVLLRNYMQGGQYNGEDRIDGKTVIITGSNTGIGKATALELARRGGRVIMACRDMGRCHAARDEIIKQVPSANLECRQLDLSSFASVREFAQTVKENDRVDILINNAGVAATPYLLTKDGLEMQIGVNHFGHFLLTQLLADNLKSSAPSRVIFVSSRAHESGHINFEDLKSEKNYVPFEAYSQSKLANILCAREMAKRLQGTGVTVNSLHPGLIATEITRHMSIFDNKLVQLIMRPIGYIFMKTLEGGAQTTLRLALDPKLADVSGKYFSDCEVHEEAPQGKDDEAAKRLWKVSQEITGINNI